VRKQLRPFYTPEQLARVYDHTYNHKYWPDHIERVHKTTELLDVLAASVEAKSVADLSCGDGAIVGNSIHPWETITLGDYTTTGPIEEAILHLPHTDVFVLSETLEHVEDPDNLLAMLRVVADTLLVTTPCGEITDENPEHYWGWDTDAVGDMLRAAGWTPISLELFTPVSVPYYTFQMWMCS
jgi:hypothetical protein